MDGSDYFHGLFNFLKVSSVNPIAMGTTFGYGYTISNFREKTNGYESAYTV